MALVSRTIPNLVQGVSQQPEVLRLSSQANVQENGFSSVVEGLKKRPPTNHLAKLSGSTSTVKIGKSTERTTLAEEPTSL